MNENINLCEILKDCPRGTKLYSPLYGELIFMRINHNTKSIFSIELLDERNKRRMFMSDGRYDYLNKECLLYPSKEQRDWSKWNCPNPKFDPKTLKPFDKVLVRDFDERPWKCDLFSHIKEESNYTYNCVGNWYKYCIPYNDDTKHLVGTTNEAPEYYRYWED